MVGGWMECGITGDGAGQRGQDIMALPRAAAQPKGRKKGHRGTEQGGDDRRERPAQSRAAADGSLCGTEECLCC